MKPLLRRCFLVAAVTCLPALSACKDVSSFSTRSGESFCGSVVQGAFIRSGFGPAVQMRLRLDASSLQSSPGTLSTSDGLFREAPLQVVPQLFHDPLATLQFGEGRQRNLLYIAEPADPSRGTAVTVVVSLMESGDVEVRLLRGAPPPPVLADAGAEAGTDAGADAGASSPSPSSGPPLFGVFPLERRQGSCGF